MRLPRILQVFIPFGILDDALDPSRSKKERLLYGGMFSIFLLILASVTLDHFGIEPILSDILALIAMCIYTCIVIYGMIVGGRMIFRMGKATQGLSKAGHHTLGVLCIFCGILLILVAPYILYTDYIS